MAKHPAERSHHESHPVARAAPRNRASGPRQRSRRAVANRASPAAAPTVGQVVERASDVAQLAARGLSNREIGERLFLSHRTVGSHLYRIFPKLGVTNRAQLAAVLPAS
ncbi:response regulator transcription factor [Humibacter soli]